MNNWNKVKLGHVSTLQFGYAYKSEQFIANEIPVIRIGDITENGLIPDYNCCYSKDFWEKHPELQLHENSILIAMSGATVGKSCLNNRKEKLLLNQRVTSVIATEKAITNYLLYAIKSDSFKSYVLKASMGCAQPNISGKQISDFQIPLPPIETQKQIAATLDKVIKIISENKKLLEKYDLLIKSRFIEMFGDPVANSKGWNLQKLESLGKWESGGTPSRKNADYFKGNIPWYSAGELNTLYLEDSIEKITEEAIKESSAKLFKKGSLFVGMYDTAAFKMGIAKEDCSSNQACANINPNSDTNVLWLYYELSEMKEFFLQNRRGVRQKNLNLGMIKGFEIPVPPLELQQQFASFVQQIDKSKFVVQKSLEKAETLYKSLMQEYFG